MPTDLVETPVTGLQGRTPREQIEAPKTGGREIEVIFLVDVSTSNEEPAGPDNPKTKHELVEEVLPLIVGALEGDDSQAAHEQAGGSDELGGCLTFAFSDRGRAQEIGDLNSSNIQRKLQSIDWGGQTFAMDAVKLAEADFQEEFGHRPLRNRPTQEILIITDGKLHDGDAFEKWVAQADETAVCCVAIIGYGDGHDEAVRHYTKIAEGNPYVSVVAFTGVTDPMEVAFDLRRLTGTAA